ncbi:hypothetical protein F6X40_09455 [Paraburkholderia sp. UCT31]|uniref:hypothetical protein n=1 Tax=Paraburkholderia sp. UCT31 TaxID=2615209 RepID=UPI0016560428|nr:hypothetical protein [Paraburkholderia sp. UCT31]MBC8737034.1 hypothetical protein [Paraburkholderia sp. UCT31]
MICETLSPVIVKRIADANERLKGGVWFPDSLDAPPRVPSLPFEVGQTYPTLNGKLVTIVEESTTRGYECAKGDDDKWRYNREQDRGRCTACNFNNPDNLVPTPMSELEDAQAE